jgi:hypothetical protein
MRADPMPTDLGEAVLERAVTAYAEALGDRLVAGYALGSLAHGGFSPLVSDVDLGLILADPLQAGDHATIGDVAGAVRASGPGLPERLSVFWGTPSTLGGQVPGGRFPPLDRLDLLEHGRLLTGRDARQAAARPDRTELLVAGARFALGSLSGTGTGSGSGSGPPADASVLDEIRAPSRLVSGGPRRLTKIVLFPVRFLYTAATGQAGLTALAVEHYLATQGAPAAALVTAALAWRTHPPADATAAAALAERELIPLYVYYIDDHVPRLLAAGQHELADRFRQWRVRLTA